MIEKGQIEATRVGVSPTKHAISGHGLRYLKTSQQEISKNMRTMENRRSWRPPSKKINNRKTHCEHDCLAGCFVKYCNTSETKMKRLTLRRSAPLHLVSGCCFFLYMFAHEIHHQSYQSVPVLQANSSRQNNKRTTIWYTWPCKVGHDWSHLHTAKSCQDAISMLFLGRAVSGTPTQKHSTTSSNKNKWLP